MPACPRWRALGTCRPDGVRSTPPPPPVDLLRMAAKESSQSVDGRCPGRGLSLRSEIGLACLWLESLLHASHDFVHVHIVGGHALAGGFGQVPGVRQHLAEHHGGHCRTRYLTCSGIDSLFERAWPPPGCRGCHGGALQGLDGLVIIGRRGRARGTSAFSSAAGLEIFEAADQVVHELFDIPLRAQGRTIKLFGPNTARDRCRSVCGLLERRQDIHTDSPANSVPGDRSAWPPKTRPEQTCSIRSPCRR